MGTPVSMEPPLKYHPCFVGILTWAPESGLGTLSGGQFDWGGRLLKGNGGAQRFPQRDWQSGVECNGKSVLNCETDKSSRCGSRS